MFRPPETPVESWLLWVDRVGGYLLCPHDEVMIGQPVPGSRVDIPILGDISRRHARIRRDSAGYVLDACRPCRVGGRAVAAMAPLVDGAVIELGSGVRLQFRQPHPLCRTARLDFLSHHRTQPSVDGVILLAEACVLGPAATNHVVCRQQAHDVVLFRQRDQLVLRAPGEFQLDGRAESDSATLFAGARVVGRDFSLSLERIRRE